MGVKRFIAYHVIRVCGILKPSIIQGILLSPLQASSPGDNLLYDTTITPRTRDNRPQNGDPLSSQQQVIKACRGNIAPDYECGVIGSTSRL